MAVTRGSAAATQRNPFKDSVTSPLDERAGFFLMLLAPIAIIR